jgi:hypothetical protein
MEQRNMGDSVAGGKTFSGGRMDDVWNRDNMQARWWREKKKRTPRLFRHGFSVGGNSLLPPVAPWFFKTLEFHGKYISTYSSVRKRSQ